MNTLKARQQELLEEIELFEPMHEKFNYLLSEGETLPPMPEHLCTPAYLITGCKSKTYFAVLNAYGAVRVCGQSNAGTLCGIIKLLIRLTNGLAPEELRAEPITILHDSGIFQNLTPQRQDAVSQMLDRFKAL